MAALNRVGIVLCPSCNISFPSISSSNLPASSTVDNVDVNLASAIAAEANIELDRFDVEPALWASFLVDAREGHLTTRMDPLRMFSLIEQEDEPRRIWGELWTYSDEESSHVVDDELGMGESDARGRDKEAAEAGEQGRRSTIASNSKHWRQRSCGFLVLRLSSS
ncbi:hypothetical protein C8J56DRAFT_1056625 [Mycena floridula]|nr:hypothetical protein C8J56DRAFT_1056625 [Mycena floridula]